NAGGFRFQRGARGRKTADREPPCRRCSKALRCGVTVQGEACRKNAPADHGKTGRLVVGHHVPPPSRSPPTLHSREKPCKQTATPVPFALARLTRKNRRSRILEVLHRPSRFRRG